MSAEPLRLLLADDEPLALRRIKLALQGIPDVCVVGAASDGAQAISAMRELRPDVVLLDIRMPLANGFEVANAVEEAGGPEVIFVSAFDSYALQAFETSAVDYLVKPVEFERLAAAIERVRASPRRQGRGPARRRTNRSAGSAEARSRTSAMAPATSASSGSATAAGSCACRSRMLSASRPSAIMCASIGRGAHCCIA